MTDSGQRYLSSETTRGYALITADGASVRLDDILFDGNQGDILHVVGDASTGMAEKRLLFCPRDMGPGDHLARRFSVLLTQAEMRSRDDVQANGGDDHVTSARALIGYTVVGRDGDAGTVRDTLFHLADWRVHYLVVKEARIWPHQVLLSVHDIGEVNDARRTVTSRLLRGAIRELPVFDRRRHTVAARPRVLQLMSGTTR